MLTPHRELAHKGHVIGCLLLGHSQGHLTHICFFSMLGRGHSGMEVFMGDGTILHRGYILRRQACMAFESTHGRGCSWRGCSRVKILQGDVVCVKPNRGGLLCEGAAHRAGFHKGLVEAQMVWWYCHQVQPRGTKASHDLRKPPNSCTFVATARRLV